MKKILITTLILTLFSWNMNGSNSDLDFFVSAAKLFAKENKNKEVGRMDDMYLNQDNNIVMVTSVTNQITKENQQSFEKKINEPQHKQQAILIMKKNMPKFAWKYLVKLVHKHQTNFIVLYKDTQSGLNAQILLPPNLFTIQ